MEFETKVADFVSTQALVAPAERILLAVSGGADSTALMHAMSALNSAGIVRADLLCCHINHQLRGTDADRDEDFVRASAAQLNLPLTTRKVDVRAFAGRNKLSIETAGRKLRIQTLLEVARNTRSKCVATAHQKNDNAETLVQRFLRGTGFRGLCGIWPTRTFGEAITFIRPLLCVTRSEIIEYLRNRNLKWCTDHTNFDCAHTRNSIRHRLLPALQQNSSDSLIEQLSQLAQAALGFHALVRSAAEHAWAESADCSGDKAVLNVKKLAPQHPAVKLELVRRSLTTIGSGLGNLTQKHYEQMLQLAKHNVSGRHIVLPNGFVVRHEYQRLVFSRQQKQTWTSPHETNSIQLAVPGVTRSGPYLIEASLIEGAKGDFSGLKTDSCLTGNHAARKTNFVERFDFEKVALPVVVRARRDGDRFWPLGLTGDKKVGKFLTAAKIAPELRKGILIVADTEKIIWVWPIRISEQVKVDTETRKILQLKIIDKNAPDRHE